MKTSTDLTHRDRIDYAKAAIDNTYEAYLDAQDMRYILHGIDYSSKSFTLRFARNVSDFLAMNFQALIQVFPWMHMNESDISEALYEIVTE